MSRPRQRRWTLEKLLSVLRSNGGSIQVHRYRYRNHELRKVVAQATQQGLVSRVYSRDFITVYLKLKELKND